MPTNIAVGQKQKQQYLEGKENRVDNHLVLEIQLNGKQLKLRLEKDKFGHQKFFEIDVSVLFYLLLMTNE